MFFGASCSKNPPLLHENPISSNTVTSPVGFMDPSLSNIAIIVLDYQTLQFERAYLSRQEPCNSKRQPVPEDEIKERAGGIFNATGKYWSQRIVTDEKGNEREELDFEIQYKGDLAILEISPGDFGGFTVSHRCSGLVLYAGSIIWSGTGEQMYPANPISSNAITRDGKVPNSPQRLDVVVGPAVYSVKEESGIAAWKSVQNMNLVEALAKSPFDVLVYLYPRTVGEFNPNKALWIVFVHRYPSE